MYRLDALGKIDRDTTELDYYRLALSFCGKFMCNSKRLTELKVCGADCRETVRSNYCHRFYCIFMKGTKTTMSMVKHSIRD